MLFTQTFRDQVKNSGFAILAPLWTDNDSSFPDAALTYQQYDKNLRFGSQNKSLVNGVLATAQEDVTKYLALQDFTATWVMIITWNNMYPRQLYDPSKDKYVSRERKLECTICYSIFVLTVVEFAWASFLRSNIHYNQCASVINTL